MTNTKNNSNEEEVDLGSLFLIIGKGFSNLFNFIGGVFRGVFDFFIQILLFLKSNFIKIGIAILVGVIVGAYLNFSRGVVYKSEMVVQPNFKSTEQLYKNIEYYNTLTKLEDKTPLMSAFNINQDEAKSLERFSIHPIKTEKDIVASYDGIIRKVDTLAAKGYLYENFKNSFTDLDYSFHKIKVESKHKDIFAKLENAIINDINNNSYFKIQKEISIGNIKRTEQVFKNNLQKADTLQNSYIKALLLSAKQETKGTTIDMGSTNNAKPKEIELFTAIRNINNELSDINVLKGKKTQIINIISSFQKVGSKAGGVLGNKYIKFGLLGGALMTLFLLLIKLNSYLNNYKLRNNTK